MKEASVAEVQDSVPALEKGQVWKMNHVYIQIVELGIKLIHFRMIKNPTEKYARTLTSGVDTLIGYLRSRHAELISAGTE